MKVRSTKERDEGKVTLWYIRRVMKVRKVTLYGT